MSSSTLAVQGNSFFTRSLGEMKLSRHAPSAAMRHDGWPPRNPLPPARARLPEHAQWRGEGSICAHAICIEIPCRFAHASSCSGLGRGKSAAVHTCRRRRPMALDGCHAHAHAHAHARSRENTRSHSAWKLLLSTAPVCFVIEMFRSVSLAALLVWQNLLWLHVLQPGALAGRSIT